MITFKQFLMEQIRPNPIPFSKDYNQDRGNLDFMVYSIESRKRLTKKKINTKTLVDYGILKATQDHLTSHGGGDPVFPDLANLPVIYQHKGIGYILDGHHRLAESYKKNTIIQVYWVK